MFRKKTAKDSKQFLEHEIKKRLGRVTALPTNLMLLDDSFFNDERKKKSLESFIEDITYIENLLLRNIDLMMDEARQANM